MHRGHIFVTVCNCTYIVESYYYYYGLLLCSFDKSYYLYVYSDFIYVKVIGYT